MSKIPYLEKLLNGVSVEWKTFSEATEIKRGTSITRKDVRSGDIPVIAGGRTPAYFHNESNRTGQTIVIAGSGAYAGFVSWWEKPIFVSDAFTIKPCENLLPKYCFYFLKDIQQKLHDFKSGGGVPHVYPRNVAPLKIPIPPLPVQEKIVDILDSFTELEAELEVELEAELEARQQQYIYYLNYLFSFNKVESQPLGYVGKFIRGTGLQKKDFTESGVGCIHYGQLYTHYGVHADETKTFTSESIASRLRKAKKGDLVIATTGESDEDLCKAVAWLGDKDVAVSSDAYIYQHSLNPKYVAYFFMTNSFHKQKRPYITGTKVRRVKGEDMDKIKIPVPSPEEQERIVDILDNFDLLVNDISIELPAESTVRRQQYEYYRNQLLTFEEVA